MLGHVCWFCHRYSNMTFREGRGAEGSGWIDAMGVVSCDSCQHLSLVLTRIDTRHQRPSAGVEEALRQADPEALVWLPQKGLGKDFADVPEPLADAASEVHQCLSIQAHRAAVALARAVVEATAKDKGITSGTLQHKIDGLAEAGLIREHTREAAHEVRLDGNGVAHGDLAVAPPDAEEALEIVTLMDELLAEVYQGPARVARVRASRARRSEAGRG